MRSVGFTSSDDPGGPAGVEDEFARAWADPRHTRFEPPPVDVNRVLAERYRMSEPLTFTRTMLWDAEVRKAWHPDIYLPHVVREGSALSWNAADDLTTFDRASRQRRWLEQDDFGLVLERVRLNPAEQRVTFVGAARLPGPDGTTLRAGTKQPLFHIEHAVGGEEREPLNQWRIVHLTEEPDERLAEALGGRTYQGGLPGFIEVYIRSVLNIRLDRTDTA
ncbi:hypothetical protein [Nonomuraea roseoviolacea]|uniref:SRPBCC family protein n=1 Tax=Nonomuraea roseoviolacea subsp. carminata TaxID=160689 RepID=A0ABT1K7F8_9ACTN|nr:hypothetical protein [Nonomuraea roseoviolacea]MCP2349937.1 hypothetical protein [Nonomuraea roseoviolacea subsp. carminata]